MLVTARHSDDSDCAAGGGASAGGEVVAAVLLAGDVASAGSVSLTGASVWDGAVDDAGTAGQDVSWSCVAFRAGAGACRTGVYVT